MIATPKTQNTPPRYRSLMMIFPVILVLGLAWLLHHRQTLGTSLLKAVSSQDSAAVASLLRQGASPNATDGSSHTALFLALDPGEINMEPNMDDGEMPEIRTNQWAFSYPRFPVQRERIVALLLNAGADPNHASNGDSYLFLALYDHSLPSVKALLAHGADPNGSYGLSPLLNKAIENDAELHAIGNDESPVYTQAMLAAGANAHLRRTYVGGSGSVFVEEPPLLVAAYDADDFHYQGGDPALIETLLAHGADINGRNQMGKTALLVAAAQGDAEIVRILLAHGAAPDMVNRQGHTALQVVQTVEASRLALATRSGKPLKKWLKNALKQRNTSEIQNVEDNIGWNDEAKIRKGYDAVQALLIKAQSAAIH